MEHTCIICNNQFKRPGKALRKYCSRECDNSQRKGKAKPEGFGLKVSIGNKGKSKPWNLGENNPNYKNKAQSKYRQKFLAAVKKRGQPWSQEEMARHSIRMLGNSNKMRGTKHTQKTKQTISKKVKLRWKEKKYKNIYKYRKVSKVEEKFIELLKESFPELQTQFPIPNTNYCVDAYLPSKNLVIEFQGNYWHANPNMYAPNDKFSLKDGETFAKDIWKRDKLRLKKIQEQGFLVVFVWEKDFRKDPKSQINKIIGGEYDINIS